MKFGVCIGGDVETLKKAKELGFDYFEVGFNTFAAEENDEKYEQLVQAVKEVGLPCEAANCFIPGTMPVNGLNVDDKKLAAYIERGMSRGKPLGLRTVVFGSGGARAIHDNFPYRTAAVQIGHFLREVVAPIAEKYDITVVVEPLCDCTIINTVKEGVLFASMSGSQHVQGLADLYHMAVMNDDVKNIRDVKGALAHAHIAQPEGRTYPIDASKYDYKSFIDALEYAGCPRCSIEANAKDWFNDAPKAIAVLRSCID